MKYLGYVACVVEPKGKLGRRDTPRPSDLKNRIELLSQPLSAFTEEEEEEKENVGVRFDEEKEVITEQKTITKVYEEVTRL